MEHLNAGNAAYVDAEYEAAVKHYSSAIADGGSADAYSKRAAAHLQLAKYTEADSDATASLKLQPTLKAYWRKGQACFSLQEYESAKAAFAKAVEFDPSSRELKRWKRKCDAELESATGATPPLTPVVPAAAAAPPASGGPSAPPATTDSSKVRHEWYQSSTHVVVSILARGIAKEAVSVDFADATVDVAIKMGGGAECAAPLRPYSLRRLPGRGSWWGCGVAGCRGDPRRPGPTP